MRASKLLIPTLKETPADAELKSHQLMLRGGLIRQLAAGLYTWLPLGLRVIHKLEAIIRDELDRAGAQELLMPFVQPSELWVESDRWQKMGPELMRLMDRSQRDLCLGPTHEEVITDLVRREIKSYRDVPCNLYQINIKFRDEIRPRFGVMRSREFIMKDGYSFHANEASFDETYQAMFQAYTRILERVGVNFRPVLADSGNIGGNISHEFQVLADAGEDRVVFSSDSDYAANIEKATALEPQDPRPSPSESLEKVATPGCRTIEEVATFLDIPEEQTVKTLFVVAAGDDGVPAEQRGVVALVLRGDHELNEVKGQQLPGVANPLAFAVDAAIQEATQTEPGSLGPIGLDVPCFVDRDAAHLADFVCGANQTGFHFRGANWDRDTALPVDCVVDIRNIVAGDPSPDGSGTLSITHGIEVGHIFQLGTIYSEKLGAKVLDQDGRERPLIMGCYGLGVTRLVAAIIEQFHDDAGIVWPESVAPFDVHVLGLNYAKSDAVKSACEELHDQLFDAGLSVLLDDRAERPGVKFADADLIGLPHRLIVGERNLKNDLVEYRRRDSDATRTLQLADAAAEIVRLVT